MISDATASGNREHYKTTLERVSDYYGLVMSIERFKKAMNDLDKVRKHEVDLNNISDTALNAFLEEFNLLDPRTFALSSTWTLKIYGSFIYIKLNNRSRGSDWKCEHWVIKDLKKFPRLFVY